jgi:hypothetical protein
MYISNLIMISNIHCLHSNQSYHQLFKTEKKESGGLIMYEYREWRHLFYHISIIKREKIQKKLQTKNDRYVKQVASNPHIGNCLSLSLLPIKIIQREGEGEKKRKTRQKVKKK